jgi:hypothetical protein
MYHGSGPRCQCHRSPWRVRERSAVVQIWPVTRGHSFPVYGNDHGFAVHLCILRWRRPHSSRHLHCVTRAHSQSASLHADDAMHIAGRQRQHPARTGCVQADAGSSGSDAPAHVVCLRFASIGAVARRSSSSACLSEKRVSQTALSFTSMSQCVEPPGVQSLPLKIPYLGMAVDNRGCLR